MAANKFKRKTILCHMIIHLSTYELNVMSDADYHSSAKYKVTLRNF